MAPKGAFPFGDKPVDPPRTRRRKLRGSPGHAPMREDSHDRRRRSRTERARIKPASSWPHAVGATRSEVKSQRFAVHQAFIETATRTMGSRILISTLHLWNEPPMMALTRMGMGPCPSSRSHHMRYGLISTVAVAALSLSVAGSLAQSSSSGSSGGSTGGTAGSSGGSSVNGQPELVLELRQRVAQQRDTLRDGSGRDLRRGRYADRAGGGARARAKFLRPARRTRSAGAARRRRRRGIRR